MKEIVYRIMAWASLLLGVLFVILPIIPGVPLLILSASLFALA